ncbi:MAG: arginine repressor [Chlorobiaceae bacterium]|nr:arginine repressor [Chlorobiaceae bacterium]NTV26816.1 arginine repressor [Chlorobiaceae bacterium]
MNKTLRQRKIRELVENREVSGQLELLGMLEETGIRVAQATLSRDFAELGIVRKRSGHGYRLELPETSTEEIIRGLVGMEVLSVASNETSVILRTLAGRAHGVASFLDRLKSPEILGTIAGDDTVLIIPASITKISAVKSYIQKSLSQT